MSESRYGLLAIAATMSVASSLAATAAAQPDKDVPTSIANITLAEVATETKYVDWLATKAAPKIQTDKSVPLKNEDPARTKRDKR